MAKRRKKAKSGGRKSGRRMRGIANNDAMYLVLGGLIGSVAMTWISQKVSFLQGKWIGIAEMAVGFIMAWKIGSPFAKGIGVGIAIAGGNNTAKGFGLLAGIGYTRDFRRMQQPSVNGFREVPKIGQAFPKPPVVGRPDMSRVYAGVYN